MSQSSFLRAVCGTLLIVAVSGPATAFEFTAGDTTLTIGGYIKLDFSQSIYTEGPAPADRGRQFTIPALIPVGSGPSDNVTDFNARESRVNIGTVTPLGGHRIASFLEIDFLDPAFDSAVANNERLVNDTNPRLRHAFIAYGDPYGMEWIFGQTWSTFMELGAYPELLDFIGPSEGMVFIRQAQIRWTRGPIQVALENPEATITPNGGGRVVNDNENLPDMVLKYKFSGSGGNLIAVGALLRQLDGDGDSDRDGVQEQGGDKAFAYGLSLSGKVMLGSDDIRFQINYGDGIGRYLGLNTANGAVVDNNGNLETIEAIGGYVAYRRVWSPRWRSNLSYGFFQADNDTSLTGTGVTETAQSVNVNLLFSPVTRLTLGVEYIYSDRELENGLDGALHRTQLSAKLSF